VTSSPATDLAAARGTRVWTLHSGDGALDVEVTAADDEQLDAVLAGVGELLGTAPPEA
jgi:hypothetical protein